MNEIKAIPQSTEYRVRDNWFTITYSEGKVKRIVMQEKDHTIIFDGNETQVNELFEAVQEILNGIK